MRTTGGYLRRCRIVGKGWRPQGEPRLVGTAFFKGFRVCLVFVCHRNENPTDVYDAG